MQKSRTLTQMRTYREGQAYRIIALPDGRYRWQGKWIYLGWGQWGKPSADIPNARANALYQLALIDKTPELVARAAAEEQYAADTAQVVQTVLF